MLPMRAALIVLLLLCTGCGGARQTATTTTTAKKLAVAPLGLRVGIAGALDVAPVDGVRFVRGRIATMPALPLVLVSAESTKLTDVLSAARRYPTSHYAYVGGSLSGSRQPNVVGVVLRDDEAARLGGFVAGLVADEEGGVNPRVAWVGPEEQELADAFADGVHDAAPDVTVLRAFSADAPAACKEAALAAIGRGAVALMAHRGLCADATVAGAHQQNDVGLRTSDFELANVPVDVLVRDAQKGVYHGGEDLVFGAASGAIGVGQLDPRISGEAGVRARSAAQQMANGLRPSG
jgi:basic membrane lipoprotein Med (substrate-binding protein (PBP1-ABC) superfamily)